MAAPTEVYCDPAIAANSGTGSIGDPYGDVQYALNTVTRDATNGNRLNIKAGTDEVLAATLSLATYGTPSLEAPLIFRGYTSAAGDGGIGGISGAATYKILTSTGDGIAFEDMHLHNSGSAVLLELKRFNAIIGCQLNNTSGNGLVLSGSGFCIAENNYLHDIGGYGISVTDDIGPIVRGNYLANGSKTFTRAISLTSSAPHVCHRNIATVSGATVGIYSSTFGSYIEHNSILSSGGTGTGIYMARSLGSTVQNNLIEGFSGAGGIGIDQDSSTEEQIVLRMNGVYNCTSAYTTLGDTLSVEDNETLGATPFAKSGSDTFANRGTYFAAANTGNVQGGAYPTELGLDKGAVQHAAAAGGGAPRSAGMSGGIF